VAVLRPEEVELAAAAEELKSSPVGYGEVQEILFAGSVERLRVRMPEDGPVPVAPGRDDGLGAVLEVSRTLPEQREFPVGVGRRVAVGARRTHVLPTPISSFTVVADDPTQAKVLRESPLLGTLVARMQTRLNVRLERGSAAPPGMPVLATGAGSADTAQWLLDHGARQLLCLAPEAPLPGRVVIFAPDAKARRATFAVAASLLRHLPAEATYLSIGAPRMPEADRAALMRQLLDARSAALAEHGLDMRTEVRDGDVGTELLREVLAQEPTMLVLGIGNLAGVKPAWFVQLLEGPVQRSVLVVRPHDAEPSADS
jgi:hypothetical protein